MDWKGFFKPNKYKLIFLIIALATDLSAIYFNNFCVTGGHGPYHFSSFCRFLQIPGISWFLTIFSFVVMLALLEVLFSYTFPNFIAKLFLGYYTSTKDIFYTSIPFLIIYWYMIACIWYFFHEFKKEMKKKKAERKVNSNTSLTS